jgi:hypothetical protein
MVMFRAALIAKRKMRTALMGTSTVVVGRPPSWASRDAYGGPYWLRKESVSDLFLRTWRCFKKTGVYEPVIGPARLG